MSETKKKIGRPPKYTDPEEFERKAEEYFDLCDSHVLIKVIKKKNKPDVIEEIPTPMPYTVPGLAYHLGFADRHEVWFYRVHNKKFSHTVKKIMLKIENQRIEGGLTRKRSEPVSIFDLKNNFGYKDKIEQEISGPGGGPIAITAYPPEPEALANWEAQMLESRKAKQIPEKT